MSKRAARHATCGTHPRYALSCAEYDDLLRLANERMENHRNTGWRHEALHLLYRSASLGRQHRYRVRIPLVHRIHLIPGRWIRAACSRHDSRRKPGWHYPAEPVARVEPPIEFTSPPPMPEAELEALRLRPHP